MYDTVAYGYAAHFFRHYKDDFMSTQKNERYRPITFKLIGSLALTLVASSCFSAEQNAIFPESQNVIIEKQHEDDILPNNFAVSLYKPNYILPFYFTGSPYNSIYVNETPNDESLKQTELKFQLSFKIPIVKKLLSNRTNIYFGYTQLSYWQLYNRHPFFRSTDYEPEFFIQNKINWLIGENWYFNDLTIGAVHQSNGFGNTMERSWNRVYLETTFSNDHISAIIRPWVIFKDSSYKKYNPDLAKYLGYGEIILGYKFGNQTISLQTHSIFECAGRYATGTLNYSFPISPYLNGFVQVFSGYGQSMIEYNHRTNSIGLGLTLNNYI